MLIREGTPELSQLQKYLKKIAVIEKKKHLFRKERTSAGKKGFTKNDLDITNIYFFYDKIYYLNVLRMKK